MQNQENFQPNASAESEAWRKTTEGGQNQNGTDIGEGIVELGANFAASSGEFLSQSVDALATAAEVTGKAATTAAETTVEIVWGMLG